MWLYLFPPTSLTPLQKGSTQARICCDGANWSILARPSGDTSVYAVTVAGRRRKTGHSRFNLSNFFYVGWLACIQDVLKVSYKREVLVAWGKSHDHLLCSRTQVTASCPGYVCRVANWGRLATHANTAAAAHIRTPGPSKSPRQPSLAEKSTFTTPPPRRRRAPYKRDPRKS